MESVAIEEKTLERNSKETQAYPEWLKLNVDEALPDDYTIWVPTNNLETSSLIRVPKYPRTFNEEELLENPALKDFQIIAADSSLVYTLSGVRNEQISAQIALGAKKPINHITAEISDFMSAKGDVISKSNFQKRVVKYHPVHRSRSEYVWSPKLEGIVDEGVSGTMAPNVVGDALIETDTIDLKAYTAQPVWLTCHIPKNATPDTYKGTITVNSKAYGKKTFKIELVVSSPQLPDPDAYQFNLDLWLNPSAIAEYYNLEHWSDLHWNRIQEYLNDYASHGGKNIATTITHEPWHKPWLGGATRSQVQFGYQSMVKWIKTKNGDWEFDYTIFDKYVTMATHTGITGAINAFSLTPFHTQQKIVYWDEVSQTQKSMELDITDKAYEDIWTQFLKHFKTHLQNQGWYERTFLGFDEKPEDILHNIMEIINAAAPEFLNRIVIAGHPEATVLAQNLSISYMFFPEQALEHKAKVPVRATIAKRKKSGKQTTFYLCAEPAHPNTLTYSPAVEARLIPWLALKYNTDGYMRWAYNNWTADPFKNPVFLHSQGDDYYVYPGKDGPISSIRWELLKEGIEDYELYKIMEKKGDISKETLYNAIEWATKNQDGRRKNVSDMMHARNMILGKDK
ncbi:DUF6067 family protein [Flavivirga amylovorans]|uniref:DUF6067 family protein n=1 Tax=Flavivirga amylovorans TaxID=870486 RepID=A0ABT8WYL2_9FLAO|nr:glycoside hydrolase domain-containing protein [Flavivirga amylovorans]MDO5986764.1 DUF6067 family protein [Flavivirga amylovorans]